MRGDGVAVELQNLRTPEPPNPRTIEHQHTRTLEPQNPSTPELQNPRTQEPQNTRIPEPQNPRTPEAMPLQAKPLRSESGVNKTVHYKQARRALVHLWHACSGPPCANHCDCCANCKAVDLAFCGAHLRSLTQLAHFGAHTQGIAVQIILADCAISWISVLSYLKLNMLSAHDLAQLNVFFAIAHLNAPFAIS